MANQVTISNTQVIQAEDQTGYDNLIGWLDGRGFESASLGTLKTRVDDEPNLKVTLVHTTFSWLPD